MNAPLPLAISELTKDFFSEYMDYVGLKTSEAPAIYHRWTCASVIGALLGRQVYIPFGHQIIYPNQYMMLMGDPGARKGSAMGIGKTLLKKAGYGRFAADKTSKERFLMDMKQFDVGLNDPLADLEALVMDDPSETYVMSGEFTDFIGQNNMDFITMLTNLWDNLPVYEHPKITGKSVVVMKPTVNLIGANTVQGFSLAFPPEALGNGFLSRMLMIYGEATGVKVAWPAPPDPLKTEILVWHLREMAERMQGEMIISDAARKLGSTIYGKELPVDDSRFSHYGTRRFTHLLKLCMIIAASELTMTITEEHMIRANTMLAMAERKMPMALGEYGKSKNSDVSNQILAFLGKRIMPATPNEIYKEVHRDLQKQSELGEILNSLKLTEKIQTVIVKGKSGYLLNKKVTEDWPEHLLNMGWMTEAEQF